MQRRIRYKKCYFDFFGAFVAAFLTAVGGGTVRDAILGSTPVFWLLDSTYLLVIIIAIVLTQLFSRFILSHTMIFLILDAIGIGVFTQIGITKAYQFSIFPPLAVVLGVMTAVFGGILRDIFCNEIPLILRKEIYATACLIGGFISICLRYFTINEHIVTTITILVIVSIRLISIKFNFSLPKLTIKR